MGSPLAGTTKAAFDMAVTPRGIVRVACTLHTTQEPQMTRRSASRMRGARFRRIRPIDARGQRAGKGIRGGIHGRSLRRRGPNRQLGPLFTRALTVRIERMDGSLGGLVRGR